MQALSTRALGPGWEDLDLAVEVWRSYRVLEGWQHMSELGLLRQARCVTPDVEAGAQVLSHHGLFLLVSN